MTAPAMPVKDAPSCSVDFDAIRRSLRRHLFVINRPDFNVNSAALRTDFAMHLEYLAAATFMRDNAVYDTGKYASSTDLLLIKPLEQLQVILRHFAEGKNSVKPLLSGGLGAEKPAGLTDGQREAGNLILTTRDRFTAIQGYAGVGKTTQFRTVSAALNALEDGPEIRGLAPTHRAVSELSGAGILAQTIASFLSESSQWQAAGQARDFRNTVFVIDESSMNGNAQLASLMNVIAEGGGRAVLSGDKDQLKSLESGAPFALALKRSAADVAVMKEIVRQIPALKPAVEAVTHASVRATRRRWYEHMRMATLVSRRDKASKQKRRKRLSKLPLDDRRNVMAKLLRARPAHVWRDLPPEDFDRLVWKCLRQLDLGLDYEPVLPPGIPDMIH